MENKQVKETKERKSFKEVVNDNREKIIVIGGVIVTAAVGIAINKNYINVSKGLKKTDTKTDLGLLLDNELWEKVTVTENIINNSGIIDQAKATVTRKKDTLVGKLNCLSNMVQINDDIKEKISQLKGGIDAYDKMLDQYDELEYLYKCRTIGEGLLDD